MSNTVSPCGCYCGRREASSFALRSLLNKTVLVSAYPMMFLYPTSCHILNCIFVPMCTHLEVKMSISED